MTTNTINIIIQIKKDDYISSCISNYWSRNEVADFLLKLEGEVTISHERPNQIIITMTDEDFVKTCLNFDADPV